MQMNPLIPNKKTVSIVIPCYNPADGWCKALLSNMRELNALLPWYNVQYIVSNDGSTRLNPGSVRSVSKFANLVFLDNTQNQGKGSAIRKGTALADGDIIIYVDIDFPFGVHSVVEMVRQFENDPSCQFVYGNRTAAYFKNLPLKRQVVSKALHMINGMILSRSMTDTQAGIKGLRKELKQEVLSTKTNTFVFEIELMKKLVKKNVVIKSIDVSAIPSIVFTDFSSKVLFNEAVNLSRILYSGMIQNLFYRKSDVISGMFQQNNLIPKILTRLSSEYAKPEIDKSDLRS
jgi:glycosyltransferase involved in cell wall biosynthesis